MKTCPTCGTKLRPDLTECPHDGTALPGPPTATGPQGPPPGPPPPTRSQPSPAPKPQPQPSGWSSDGLSGSLTEKSTASSWVFAVVACGLIAGGYFLAKDHLLGGGDEAQVETAPDDSDGKKKKKKRKRKKRKRSNERTATAEENYDDYDWEQDYDDNGVELGDVFARGDDEEYVEVEPAKPPPPYEPSRDEYQPNGSYKPTASWSVPGANSNVTTLDLGSGKSNAPLDESQVKSVLSVRQVAPCYDPWVQKIPQMQGRVHLSFVIAEDGKVASVKVTRSQLRSRVVESCIVKRARKFRFPRSEGGKTKFETHFDFTNR